MATTPKAGRLPDISMETIGGQTVRVAHWSEIKQSDKRPLLFFNGIGANLELAFGLGEWITDREIITFDMPGVGESPAARFPYRPWMMARLARKLCDRFGMGDVDVMGVSWGGAMAQQYAFQYRNSVGKLILCATTAGMTMVPGKISAISKMADARRYSDPEFMRENFQRLYGEAADEGAGQHITNLKPPAPMGYVYQLIAFLGWSSLPFIRLMRMPTLVMAGDQDAIVPMANAHILNTALPNSRLHVVDNGGHLFLVTQADVSVPVITGFLDEPVDAMQTSSLWDMGVSAV
ncbi:MAG: alpha/beta fold hydrolase [Henriciella sp.]|nr:alpha/beta fold hydrolase [Henriciella sp.]